MENEGYDFFDTQITEILELFVESLDKGNFSVEQITNQIRNMHDLIRSGLHLTALTKGKKELADKIDKANDIIVLEEIKTFEQALQTGNEEDFLAEMNWTDKVVLQNKIKNLSDLEKQQVIKNDKRSISILEASIKKDVEEENKREALNQGFDSVEAWRKHHNEINDRSQDNLDYNKTK